MAKKIIDVAPVIAKLAERALKAKGLECSLLGSVIDMLRAAPEVPERNVGKWIPVSDQPKENGYYLCVVCCSSIRSNKELRRKILYWEDNCWIDFPNSFRVEKPLHWTYLLELPEEEI